MNDISASAVLKLLTGFAAVLIIFAALDAAQSLLAPIVAAIVVGVVFGPFTDFVERRGFPRAAAAFLVLLSLALLVAAVVLAVGPTVSHAISNGPRIWFEMRELIDLVRGAVSDVQQLQETVNETVNEALASDGGAAAAGAAAAGEAAETEVPVPTIFDALSYGPSVVAGILVFAGTLYFFLATRLDTYASLSRVFEGASVECLTAAEQRVSRYFLAITTINAGFGAITMVIMSLIGMPQPAMWGMAVFFLNYILYLGPGLLAVAFLIVGFVTFDGAMSFVPAACFVGLNMIEAQFVTPSLVGRQMSLNPLLVFLSLVLWMWLWGPIGGLVAIPLLVWVLFVFGAEQTKPEPQGVESERAA
jgi:predicted PurR-regulated permease PerM